MFMKNIRLPIYSSTAQCSRQFLHPLCLRLLQYSLAAQRACLRHVSTRNYILQFILCPITPLHFLMLTLCALFTSACAHLLEHISARTMHLQSIDLANKFKVDLDAFVCNTIQYHTKCAPSPQQQPLCN